MTSTEKARSPISCAKVAKALISCMDYISEGGRVVPPAKCCEGINKLYRDAQTIGDRRKLCECLKKIARENRAEKKHINRAGRIPSKCGVIIAYKKIGMGIDCNRDVK